jgi:glucan-binding YG repeat protein
MKQYSINHQSKLILSMMAALLILLPAQPIQVNAEANTNTADPAHIPSSESEPEKQQNNNTENTGKSEPKAQWETGANGKRYVHSGGSYTKNNFETIEEKQYYFDQSGYAVHSQWLLINGNWYYFDETGVMTTDQWIDKYYVGENGIMLRNSATPDGFYVGSDGAWIPAGWELNNVGWWYMESNGTWPAAQWKFINGNWYYFDHEGYLVTNWQTINGEWYYLRNSGEAVYGWQYINGSWYYFNSACAMVHDQWIGDYYLGSSGTMAVNQWIGNYYVRYNGACARNGWLKLGDYWYHFNGYADIDATQQYAPTLISDHGYYISPMKTGNMNTPSERIEAMISRAYDYTGSIWKACYSQAPGGYADCSGLVMQCLLAAGFDPSPAIPSHHARPENEYDSRTLYYSVSMRHVSVSELQRGDLVWYARNGIIIHIAIYLGNGQVIDSWPPRVTTHPLNWPYYGSYIIGAARPFE